MDRRVIFLNNYGLNLSFVIPQSENRKLEMLLCFLGILSQVALLFVFFISEQAFSMRFSLNFLDSSKLWLPFIAILDELFLVVEEFFVQECGVLVVRTLDDGINGTGLLAKAAENTLSHVNVVLCGAARAIRSRLRFNNNGKSRACCLTKFASNATFLTCRVSTKSVLSTEHG